MNSTQIVIAALYGAAVLVAVLISASVIRSTSERRRRSGTDPASLARRESRYAIGVTVALLILLASTLFAIPYGETDEAGAQRVEVEAFQFGWSVEPTRVAAGEPVVFSLRSRDAAHGFGLYRGTELLDQAQVPGRRPGDDRELGDEQRLVYTFDEPGTYEISCLEFCGIGHHRMVGEFEVVE